MKRILIIEDSPTQAAQYAIVLEDAGFEAETAPDAERGFARLARGGFDAVLSDLHLPGGSGFDLCRRIKADPGLRSTPIVVCTSEADPVNVLRGLEAGADGFVTKQRPPEDVIGCLTRVMDRPPSGHPPPPTRVNFLGKAYDLAAGREQLLDILVSAFEDVVHLNSRLEQEKRRSDELLHVILPDSIVVELKATNAVKPLRHEGVAVLFADIVGFTRYCEAHDPEEIVSHLQRLVEEWEEIVFAHRVEKIKTMGDAFMAAGGLLTKVENPVLNCLRCGIAMIEAAHRLPTGWDVRVGIHSGQVMAGVIGHRQYLFDLWGDAVNEAARMESHGVPGSVTLSVAAWRQVAHLCRGESLGAVAVKGKGPLEMIRFERFLDDP